MTRRVAHGAWLALKDAALRWRRDDGGLAAAEFAMVLPALILLYVGGFEFSQATSTYRKMSDLDIILANVVSQNAAVVQPGDIDGENAAATQVMAPFDVSPLTVVTMEVTTDTAYTGATAGHGTVNWSRSLQGSASAPCIKYPSNTGCVAGAQTPYPANTALTGLPTSLAPNTSYLLVETYYNYKEVVGAKFVNPIPMLSDQLFGLPRGTATITCPTCT